MLVTTDLYANDRTERCVQDMIGIRFHSPALAERNSDFSSDEKKS